jgi:predicted pyridoxine 5'-phosphate oxidase superfamily flavin-nucleotide-binding protein
MAHLNFFSEASMSKFYSEEHRSLQDRFDTRGMAELMEGNIVHAELGEPESVFIESRDMFFLSTIDPSGRPTVSYKGGAIGFVRAVSPSKLVFPWYDGNGMFYSAGNIMGSPKVGLLFIDFVTPNRLRIQGNAVVSLDDPLMASYPGAQFLIFVTIEDIWINCPRYIHPHQKLTDSRYVPNSNATAPLPAWKRLDIVQEAIPARDREQVSRSGGEITMDNYVELLMKGEA